MIRDGIFFDIESEEKCQSELVVQDKRNTKTKKYLFELVKSKQAKKKNKK
jgi:hypothetical protein